ncbi:CHAP domain-containing protein [Kibdelosporangium philippinense]|uniref:N-acetylmuramoyl-L-alanine amidase n=1 Tax=Kibdelosporangium philippinense TaxID=211113 RepID=A0ABS8ZB94_9PSEU|nr:CHAP domain-containing protein [Kibdelosporangium philippinense]MCE7004303.1 CHAP domain-containing protein [Kibdelosporangium philippinense]
MRVLLLAACLALVGAPMAHAATTAKIDTSGSAVNLRFGPGTQYGITGSVSNGQTVTIVCTTRSEPVTGKYGTSTIWDKLSNGSWVADAFVFTGTSGPVEPECGPTGIRPTADDYPYRGNPNAVDRWFMYSGQCTSWVAWRMEQVNGYFHNNGWRNGISGHWGDAHEWNDNAVRLGYRVDRTPRVGAIAQWERGAGGASGWGHVAYISAVNGNTVTVQEYNWTTELGFGTRNVPLSEISNIIHLHS